MNKPKRQGTAWETDVVQAFQLHNLPAGRYPEGGSNDLGDVWVGEVYLPGDPLPTVTLAWKRLIGDGPRRQPDGDRDVIVIGLGDFIELLTTDQPLSLAIECKATQTLNVTRTLNQARKKIYG